jgi:hypothetical protein
MKPYITLSYEEISLSSLSFKRELAKMIGLEFVNQQSNDHDVLETADDAEYAVLKPQAARAFLQNCNDKTKQALLGIVNQGDNFSLARLRIKTAWAILAEQRQAMCR